VIAALVLLLAQDGDAAALEALRARVGASVLALDVDRSEDPEGKMGRGALAAHSDYYNRPKGPVSAVVWDAEGHVVTSAFNVSGTIRKGGLRATLPDGRVVEAALLGSDEEKDVALLKVAAAGLRPLVRADLSTLAQGSFVALVGRSPDRAQATLNLGVLSAFQRMRGTAVQSDAETNYGNAGGALVTLRGELVGVACQVKPDAVWGQSGGVGFACKLASIDAVLDRLKAGERIAAPKRPDPGFFPGEGDPDVQGVQVGQVRPESEAEKAGLKPMDVITHVDGKPLTDFESLREILDEKKIGDVVDVKLKRRLPKGGWEDRAVKLKLEGRAQP
jgi:S1-C subfamily serine protease